MYFVSLMTVLGSLFCSTSAISVGYFVSDSSITGNFLVLFCERSTGSFNLLPGASTIEFFEELDNNSTAVFVDQASQFLNYVVTPQSEHFVRCVNAGEVSNFLGIGGMYLTLTVKCLP